jgi:hypothetical protein
MPGTTNQVVKPLSGGAALLELTLHGERIEARGCRGLPPASRNAAGVHVPPPSACTASCPSCGASLFLALAMMQFFAGWC